MCTVGRAGRHLKESQRLGLCVAGVSAGDKGERAVRGERGHRGNTGGRLEAAEQAVQEARVMWLMGQQGEYGLCRAGESTGRRPFLRMAVSRDSRVSGGRWRVGGGGGDWAPTDEARLSQEDRQEAWGMCSRLEPVARVCLLTLSTVGVNIPERTEEHGDAARLRDSGEATSDSCMADQLFSRSQPSENTDSREEAWLEYRLERSAVGLWSLKSDGSLFSKTPEPAWAPGQIA